MNRSGYQLKLNLFLSTGWGPLQFYAKRPDLNLRVQMIYYFIIPAFLLMFSFLEVGRGYKQKSLKTLLIAFGVFITLFAGLAVSRGDADAYKKMFLSPEDEALIELGYIALIELFRYVFQLPYVAFLVFIAAINTLAKLYSFSILGPYPLVSALIFLTSTYIAQDIGALRFSLGVSFFLLALTRLRLEKRLQFMLLIGVGSLFHVSMIFGLCLLLTFRFRWNIVRGLIFVSVMLALFFIKLDLFVVVADVAKIVSSNFGTKLAQYTLISEPASLEMGILRRIIFFLIFLVIYRKREIESPIIVNAYALSIFMYFAFSSVNLVAQRFSILFAAVEPILLAYMIMGFVRGYRILVLVVLAAIFLYGTHRSLNLYSDEINTWVPYEIYSLEAL